jgi:hypothetical protein
MLSVAWRRLEGHVIGNLLTIMNLLGGAPPSRCRFDGRTDWSYGKRASRCQASNRTKSARLCS